MYRVVMGFVVNVVFVVFVEVSDDRGLSRVQREGGRSVGGLSDSYGVESVSDEDGSEVYVGGVVEVLIKLLDKMN